MCLFIGGTDRSPRAFDEVWILKMAPESTDGVSSSDWRWIRKSTTVRGGGTLPARTGATATAVGRKVYVFGGQEPSRGTCFNDVVVLDCDSWEWSRLEISGPSPPPRNSHVACVVNGGRLLVVYGGSSPEVGEDFTAASATACDGTCKPSALVGVAPVSAIAREVQQPGCA